MRADAAAADRAAAVRQAAHAWRRAGLLDEAAVASVEARYPDDRKHLGPVFRLLVFGFALIAMSGASGLVGLTMADVPHDAYTFLALIAGLAFGGLTEILIGSLRLRQSGVEAAASLMTLLYLGGAATLLVLPSFGPAQRTAIATLGAIAAVLLAAAAWRWGYTVYAAAAMAAGLVVLATLPAGRLLWIVLPLAVTPLLLRWSATPRLPPAHRRSALAALLVAIAGLAMAIHPLSWDLGLVETIGGRASLGTLGAASGGGGALWWSAAVATVLLPFALFAAGMRWRRLSLLLAGLVAAASAAVAVGHFIHLAPAWWALILGGALAIGVALGAWRYIESGQDEERGGLTTAPLLVDGERLGLLEAGVAILTLPSSPTHAPGGEPGFSGGGGRSGGGGASGEF